jgi:hypothetical protein
MKRIADPAELLPPFRRAVEQLFVAMRAAGHEPVLHETYRTPERAARLVLEGRSKLTPGMPSMHTLRIAADVICARHQWGCGKHSCDFYQRLGAAAERLGMTWGGRFAARDLVHVQAVPVGAQQQARRSQQAELEELVAEYLIGGRKTGSGTGG